MIFFGVNRTRERWDLSKGEHGRSSSNAGGRPGVLRSRRARTDAVMSSISSARASASSRAFFSLCAARARRRPSAPRQNRWIWNTATHRSVAMERPKPPRQILWMRVAAASRRRASPGAKRLEPGDPYGERFPEERRLRRGSYRRASACAAARRLAAARSCSWRLIASYAECTSRGSCESPDHRSKASAPGAR